MGKWPYTAVALMVEGKSLLSESKLAEAKARFDEARRLEPSQGKEIDMLLAEAEKNKEPQ
jgi:hypothetical protein